ncbi:MAG: hypothetical protein KGL39_12365 [Patescibacteria group bacterium]|nr:hypothetical protein [Patescibacteria group bacterium]
MARYADYDRETVDDGPAVIGEPEMRADRPTPHRPQKLEMPPDPSQPRGFDAASSQLWRKILPEVEANSKDEEEFLDNMQRVLRALFKRQHREDPAPEELKALQELIAGPLYMFRQKQMASPIPENLEAQDTEAIEQQKRESGIAHSPRD